MQSKWPVAFILRWTSEKWNSCLIFTLCFYIVFVYYLWKFDLNLANKRRRKVIIRRVWLLRSTTVTMTWRQSNVTLAIQLLHLSDVAYALRRVNGYRSWVYEPRRTNIGSTKEIVGECKYYTINVKDITSYLTINVQKANFWRKLFRAMNESVL